MGVAAAVPAPLRIVAATAQQAHRITFGPRLIMFFPFVHAMLFLVRRAHASLNARTLASTSAIRVLLHSAWGARQSRPACQVDQIQTSLDRMRRVKMIGLRSGGSRVGPGLR
jgi:hypothetical protein